jgi:metal-responsive CopG/Arc/MetJ family transcriptional regulator
MDVKDKADGQGNPAGRNFRRLHMEIISASLDSETLSELGEAQRRLGFSSRSRLLRAAISSLLNEYRLMESRRGHVDAVFTITYREADKDKVSDVLHMFEDCIGTTVHQHHRGICLEILIVCADAARQRELFGMLKKARGLRSLSVSVL